MCRSTYEVVAGLFAHVADVPLERICTAAIKAVVIIASRDRVLQQRHREDDCQSYDVANDNNEEPLNERESD